MIRMPFVSRRGRDTGVPSGTELESRIPVWIDQMPRVGWPMVAVAVMVMCAPGEHHLAHMAGWSDRLAWLMPAVMVAYAGIAASVATRRVKGTPGRTTAVLGAWLSICLAMAAQPVSHMFVTGHWASDPAPVWIVWSVSLVPGGVLGHLMHVAASHVVSRRGSVPVSSVRGQDTSPAVPSWVTEEKGRRKASAVSRPRPPVLPKVSLSHPGRVTSVSLEMDVPASAAVSRPGPVVPSVGPSLGDRQSMSARAAVLLSQGQTPDTVKDTLRTEFTGDDGVPPKANSINKAVTRAQDKVSRAS